MNKTNYPSFEMSKYTTKESVAELAKNTKQALVKIAIGLAGAGVAADIRKMDRASLMDTIILLG